MKIDDYDEIYIRPGYTDMRKGADSLAGVVQYSMHLNPFTTAIFIFCSRRRNVIKILEWDRNGFWVHTKKIIGRDRFVWPRNEEEASAITKKQLEWLLDGLDMYPRKVHSEVRAAVVSG